MNHGNAAGTSAASDMVTARSFGEIFSRNCAEPAMIMLPVLKWSAKFSPFQTRYPRQRNFCVPICHWIWTPRSRAGKRKHMKANKNVSANTAGKRKEADKNDRSWHYRLRQDRADTAYSQIYGKSSYRSVWIFRCKPGTGSAACPEIRRCCL